jgi:hypothetical protein
MAAAVAYGLLYPHTALEIQPSIYLFVKKMLPVLTQEVMRAF